MRIDVDGVDEAYRIELAGGATAFVVIDAAIGGHAFGGIRVRHYPSEDAALADAQLLARAMTRKVLLAGLHAGGAKTVVRMPSAPWPDDTRSAAMEALGAFIESLDGRYHCGADLGFTTADASALGRGTRHVACGVLGDWTARTVLTAMRVAGEVRSAAIQGVGAVGAGVAEGLVADGVDVTVADTNAAQAGEVDGVRVVAPAHILSVECDVFSPCAVGGVLTESSIASLNCRVVCGGANNPFASATDADRLHARGIVYVPDVLANAGAVIKGASDALGESVQVEPRMSAVADRVSEVLRRAVESDRSAHHVAVEMADEMRARARP